MDNSLCNQLQPFEGRTLLRFEVGEWKWPHSKLCLTLATPRRTFVPPILLTIRPLQRDFTLNVLLVFLLEDPLLGGILEGRISRGQLRHHVCYVPDKRLVMLTLAGVLFGNLHLFRVKIHAISEQACSYFLVKVGIGTAGLLAAIWKGDVRGALGFGEEAVVRSKGELDLTTLEGRFVFQDQFSGQSCHRPGKGNPLTLHEALLLLPFITQKRVLIVGPAINVEIIG